MATRTFCDRCDLEWRSLHNVTVPGVYYNNTKTLELCDRCIAELHDWTRPVPKEALSETGHDAA